MIEMMSPGFELKFQDLTRWELAWFGVLIGLAISLPPIQDYQWYLDQWALVMQGENPWTVLGHNKTNTYGPVHNSLAPLAAIFRFLPRVLTCLISIFLYLYLRRIHGRSALLTFGYLLNPFFWVSSAVIGHNDWFVVMFTLAAFHQFDRSRSLIAGISLGLGVGLKLYPAVLFPYLAWSGKKLSFKFILGFALTCVAIVLATTLIWTDGIAYAVTHNVSRAPSGFSIYRFLQEFSPLGETIAQYSIYLIVSTQLALAGLWLVRPIHRFFAGTIAILLLLEFHHVAHSQFHILPLVSLLIILAIADIKNNDRLLYRLVIAYLLIVSTSTTAYYVTHPFGTSVPIIQQFDGVALFLVVAALMFRLYAYGRRIQSSSQTPPDYSLSTAALLLKNDQSG